MKGWFERLSHWQFVAALAGITLCALVAADYAFVLVTARINLGFCIVYDVVFTVGNTGAQAWRRWK